MLDEIFIKHTNEPKYIQLYNYYKDLILLGDLKSGTKMPSIRSCCQSFNLSKTTVETAYIQLCAEGYIISKPQSGFYVCSLENTYVRPKENAQSSENSQQSEIKFDLVSSYVDKASFNFTLWRRYVKSAFRQDERLVSYGDVQGEFDLRQAICNYVITARNVACTPSQIVVGAGTQSLLQILCSINPYEKSVSFFGEVFKQGKAVFEDYSYRISSFNSIKDGLKMLENEKTKMIYVSPSHMNKLGEVLSISDRMKILNFAKSQDCLVIEDDYGSEFRYYSRPVPSMQGIDSGKNVVYLGTFSSLLLPSIRISFMVLPKNLEVLYEKRKHLYNQTASKVEQIALCQFIRDGHLSLQIKRQRKIYIDKAKFIVKMSKEIFDEKVKFSLCQAGYLIKIEVKVDKSAEELIALAKNRGIILSGFDTETSAVLVISAAGLSNEQSLNLLKELKLILTKG